MFANHLSHKKVALKILILSSPMIIYSGSRLYRLKVYPMIWKTFFQIEYLMTYGTQIFSYLMYLKELTKVRWVEYFGKIIHRTIWYYENWTDVKLKDDSTNNFLDVFFRNQIKYQLMLIFNLISNENIEEIIRTIIFQLNICSIFRAEFMLNRK